MVMTSRVFGAESACTGFLVVRVSCFCDVNRARGYS